MFLYNDFCLNCVKISRQKLIFFHSRFFEKTALLYWITISPITQKILRNENYHFKRGRLVEIIHELFIIPYFIFSRPTLYASTNTWKLLNGNEACIKLPIKRFISWCRWWKVSNSNIVCVINIGIYK